ncbi:penicillin-binding protein activator [Pelagibacteraceae bacterium]|nr:penicillin-binding protein activator [Pelagibacteraceae bacterium]
MKYNTIILLIIPFLIYGCETVTYENNLSSKNKIEPDILNSQIKLQPDTNRVKIGILLPLSGENSQIGRSLLKAAKLSLSKTKNRNIQLLIKDTENSNTNIISSYYNLINEEVDIILGPLFTKNIKIISPVSKDENTLMITFSNNSEIKDEGTFISGLTPEDEIREAIDYAMSKGSKKFGLIFPNNEYGLRSKKLIQNLVLEKNGEISEFVFYNSDKPDFYEVSKKIADYEQRKLKLEKKLEELKNTNTVAAENKYKKLKNQDTLGELEFDSLFIGAENIKHISMLASILPYYDVDPKKVLYIGNSLWANSVALKEPALEKGIFTSFSKKKFGNFELEYSETYAATPHQIAYLAFDLVGLISNLQKKDKKIDVSNITASNGFIGTKGLFRFRSDGSVQRSLSVFQIKNQNQIEVKKANLNF